MNDMNNKQSALVATITVALSDIEDALKRLRTGGGDPSLLERAGAALARLQCARDGLEAADQTAADLRGSCVGAAGAMPGTSGFTMACFKADEVPLGTRLYTRPASRAMTFMELRDLRLATEHQDDADTPWPSAQQRLDAFARGVEAFHSVPPPEAQDQGSPT